MKKLLLGAFLGLLPSAAMFNVSSSTVVYNVGFQTCASGKLTGQGFLRARRVR